MKSLFLAALLGLASAASAKPFEWPHGARYAVSLTYDDAIPTDLKNAVPALNRAGLHGTFFLCCGAFKTEASLKEWIPVAKGGHELGSHSIEHACGKAIGLASPPGGLEAYDLARMEKELKETRSRLAALGVRPAGETYAYPCGNTWVGEDHESYIPLVARLFKAARGVMGSVADPQTVDLLNVPAVSGDKNGDALRSWAEQAESQGGWVVFVFHGVGGDYLTTKLEAHQALLDYLKSAEGLAWVAPFGEVAAWVKKHR